MQETDPAPQEPWHQSLGLELKQVPASDINLNDRPQMQNDTENEIGRSLFPFIHGLRILISFDYLYINHIDT